jgi:hypothetical protein
LHKALIAPHEKEQMMLPAVNLKRYSLQWRHSQGDGHQWSVMGW